MLSRVETVFAFLFFGALALSWYFPDSGPLGLAFLTLVVLSTPFVILHFGRTLYAAITMGYVIPNEQEGPAYRSDQPVIFWSNVILSTLFIPVIIAGAFLISGEVVRLAARL
jgi:hypothetical protein